MSGKRSRQGDSSNHVSLPVKYGKEVCGASDMRKPPKCLKASVDEGAKEQLRNNTILKPTAHETVSGGIGSFLKHCYYCKKTIHQGKDVFMYRYCSSLFYVVRLSLFAINYCSIFISIFVTTHAGYTFGTYCLKSLVSFYHRPIGDASMLYVAHISIIL